MADETVSAGQEVGLQVIDSLSAHEFELELEGEKISGILRISGFMPFKLDVKSAPLLKQVQEPFKVVKMVNRDPNAPFNRWIRDTVSAKADMVRPRRTLTLIAVDDGVEMRRWTMTGAWLCEIGYSDFNSGSAELVEETLTIQCDAVTISWPSG